MGKLILILGLCLTIQVVMITFQITVPITSVPVIDVAATSTTVPDVAITSTVVPVTSTVPGGSSTVTLMVVGIVALLGFAALFVVILLLILKIYDSRKGQIAGHLMNHHQSPNVTIVCCV